MFCEACHKRAKFACEKCKQVFYCGKKCQKQDWEFFHHKECIYPVEFYKENANKLIGPRLEKDTSELLKTMTKKPKTRPLPVVGNAYRAKEFAIPEGFTVAVENGNLVKLGEGGFSTVYLGYDQLTGQKVAIKNNVNSYKVYDPYGNVVVNNNTDIEVELRAYDSLYGKKPSCKDERQNLALDTAQKQELSMENIEQCYLKEKSKHDNVIFAYAYAKNARYTTVVLEYSPGTDLFEYFETHKDLVDSERRYIFREIVEGYNYCVGQGVIHRDLKLENVLISENGENIKLIDFNLSVIIPKRKYRAGTYDKFKVSKYSGTPGYKAPEVTLSYIRNTSYSPYVADSFSLGVILYILMTGFAPVEYNSAENEADFINELRNKKVDYSGIRDPDLVDLLQKLLTIDTSKRMRAHDIPNHPFYQIL